MIGATVGPNDILVGKVEPRGEKELSAEERLFALFSEKKLVKSKILLFVFQW
jgi:DNA-directed RNA polymerase subunit beta